MESNPFDDVILDKAKALLSYHRLRTLAVLLRLTAALLSLSWCLPLALHFLRSLSAVLATPAFFFLLCNAIILTLLANSGFLSASNLSLSDPQFHVPDPDPPIVYQDKEMVNDMKTGIQETEVDLEFIKSFRRTKSEINCPEKSDTKCVVLRRSETEMCRKIVSGDENRNREEEMSNEEFQRKIEEFIATQLKFRRQESTAGVLETSS